MEPTFGLVLTIFGQKKHISDGVLTQVEKPRCLLDKGVECFLDNSQASPTEIIAKEVEAALNPADERLIRVHWISKNIAPLRVTNLLRVRAVETGPGCVKSRTDAMIFCLNRRQE